MFLQCQVRNTCQQILGLLISVQIRLGLGLVFYYISYRRKLCFRLTQHDCAALIRHQKRIGLTLKMDFKSTTVEEWTREQESIQSRIILEDSLDWQLERRVCLVGGLDLSYVKGVDDTACAALVVCELPDLRVVYEDIVMVSLSAPYVPGFLAFREAPAFASAIERLIACSPSLVPQCFLLDGNGTLHPRSCGLACHIGVLCNIPTIGVAKNLYQMENLLRDEEHARKIRELKNKGDYFPLQTDPERVLGVALKTTDSSSKPVFVSAGHRISLETAIWLVNKCCLYRVPEPIRQADIRSREFLRNHFPTVTSAERTESPHVTS